MKDDPDNITRYSRGSSPIEQAWMGIWPTQKGKLKTGINVDGETYTFGFNRLSKAMRKNGVTLEEVHQMAFSNPMSPVVKINAKTDIGRQQLTLSAQALSHIFGNLDGTHPTVFERLGLEDAFYGHNPMPKWA